MESRGGAWWWHHRLWGGCLPFPGLRRWPNDKQQQKQPIRALICTMGKARGWSRARGERGAGVQYEIVCEWKSKWRKAVVMEGNICMSERRMEDSKRIVEKMQWLKSIDGASRWYKLMKRRSRIDHDEEIVDKVSWWMFWTFGGERGGVIICQVKHTEITLRDYNHQKSKAKPCAEDSGSSDGSVCARVVVADACTKCPFKSMLWQEVNSHTGWSHI